MQPIDFQKELDDVLGDLSVRAYYKGKGNKSILLTETITEAQQAINDLIEGVVGEYEAMPVKKPVSGLGSRLQYFPGDVPSSTKARNELRSQLLTKFGIKGEN